MCILEELSLARQAARSFSPSVAPSRISTRFRGCQSMGPWKPESFLILVCGYAMLRGEMKRKTTKSPAAQETLDCPTAEITLDFAARLKRQLHPGSHRQSQSSLHWPHAADRSANLSLVGALQVAILPRRRPSMGRPAVAATCARHPPVGRKYTPNERNFP